MRMVDMQKLSEAIEHVYQSLEKPDFSFVSKTVSSKPYDSIIQQMGKLFEVKEVTDLNEDVSFRYLLSKSMAEWVVELSMIARYAIVLNVSNVNPIIVTQNTSVPDEQKIVSLLVENQFQILEQQDLEQPFSLKLFNTHPENVCIYQALFSDIDVLPWKGSE